MNELNDLQYKKINHDNPETNLSENLLTGHNEDELNMEEQLDNIDFDENENNIQIKQNFSRIYLSFFDIFDIVELLCMLFVIMLAFIGSAIYFSLTQSLINEFCFVIAVMLFYMLQILYYAYAQFYQYSIFNATLCRSLRKNINDFPKENKKFFGYAKSQVLYDKIFKLGLTILFAYDFYDDESWNFPYILVAISIVPHTVFMIFYKGFSNIKLRYRLLYLSNTLMVTLQFSFLFMQDDNKNLADKMMTEKIRYIATGASSKRASYFLPFGINLLIFSFLRTNLWYNWYENSSALFYRIAINCIVYVMYFFPLYSQPFLSFTFFTIIIFENSVFSIFCFIKNDHYRSIFMQVENKDYDNNVLSL